MKACLDILEMKFNSSEDLLLELRNYCPKHELIYTSPLEKGASKCTWSGFYIIRLFGDDYKVKFTCLGNGGWLDTCDYQISSINLTTCKMVLKGEWL